MNSFISLLVATCLTAGCAVNPNTGDTRDQFVAKLQSLCGQRYEGGLTYAIDPKNDFAGKKMSTEIICTSTGLRMPWHRSAADGPAG